MTFTEATTVCVLRVCRVLFMARTMITRNKKSSLTEINSEETPNTCQRECESGTSQLQNARMKYHIFTECHGCEAHTFILINTKIRLAEEESSHANMDANKNNL